MMQIESIPTEKINPAPYNPRLDLKPGHPLYEKIRHSIEEFDLVEPLVWNRQTGNLVGGHQRLKILTQQGAKEVKCSVVDLPLEKEKALNLALNKVQGDWDGPRLAGLLKELDSLSEIDLDVSGFSKIETDVLLSKFDGRLYRKLSDRFVVPPFTVLDTRQGYWQARRRDWLALGIESEKGREDNLLHFSETAQLRKKRWHESYAQANLNRVMGDDSFSTGTSIFDPVLAEISYRWFCPLGGIIVDPFAGGSVRGIVAARLGYKYVGVELRGEQVEANRIQADRIFADYPEVKDRLIWHRGDSQTIDKTCNGLKADFIFTSPPYYDLELYPDQPGQLSNLPDYEAFLEVYRTIISKCLSMLKENRFACFVVGEIRDKKGFYRNFVSHTIKAFQDAGALFYNEAILVNAVGTLPARAARIFSARRKLGKCHQNVLTFYKGDLKALPRLEECKVEILEEKTDAA